jgi:hypothetical protein
VTDWLTEEMNRQTAAGIPNLDNVGDGTVDGPGTCTCPVLPGEHNDDQCAAALWEQVRR